MQTVPIDEAYYWIEPDGSFRLALRHRTPSLLGKAWQMDWQMSVVLDGLPASDERLYRLGPREIRIVQDYGGDHRRSRSSMGVAVVRQPRNHRAAGRLHATVHQQQFGILSGWSPAVYRAPMLTLVTEFEAVENAAKGREILGYTESDGFDREATSTSQPTRFGIVSPTTTAAP